MKKQTFLHKLTNWLAALGFAAVCGCMAVVNNQVQKADAYTVQKAQESVTFSVEELNECSYSYLYDYDMNTQYNGTHIQYGNDTYNYIGYNLNTVSQDYPNAYWYQTTTNQDNEYIIFMSNGRFSLYVVDEFLDTDEWQYSLTIYSKYFAENMQKSITLSANQINNNKYEYLGTQLLNATSSDFTDTYIIYNNTIFKFYNLNHLSSNSMISYKNDEIQKTILFATANNQYQYKFRIANTDIVSSFTIYSDWFADNINAPFTDGDDIIGGITSGLGLISYLATTFLNGFTGLFWQNNALTNFAMYSLIMLGIAITFSIIKLVLNILRSNTGA